MMMIAGIGVGESGYFVVSLVSPVSTQVFGILSSGEQIPYTDSHILFFPQDFWVAVW
jgi:hypothetical protein